MKYKSPYLLDCLLVSIIIAQVYWIRLYYFGWTSMSQSWGKSIYTFSYVWVLCILPSTAVLAITGLFIKKGRSLLLPIFGTVILLIMEIILPKIS